MLSKSKCMCGKNAPKKCSGCKVQRYCSVECQKNDWSNHKKVCSPNLKLKEEDVDYYFKKGLGSTNDVSKRENTGTTIADKQKDILLNITKSPNKDWIKNFVYYKAHNDIEERKERIHAHIRKNWCSIIDTLLSSHVNFSNKSKELGCLLYVKSKSPYESSLVYYYFIFHVVDRNPGVLYVRYAINEPVEYYTINSVKQHILTSFDIVIGKHLIKEKKDDITTVPYYEENADYKEVNWENGELIEK